MDSLVEERARTLIKRSTERGMKITTAESCTGGLIAAALTDIPGASATFTHGFVTYSNQAKQDMLDVSTDDLERYGAVSAEVAIAMVNGACRKAEADLALAVTGIAGPGGGTAEKPVGLVYIAAATQTSSRVYRHLYPQGSRSFIRLLTVRSALTHLLHEMA
ncbi:CinA family protein [Parvularcula sp. LCG005]|uniref:CinA family protein n=1 Tax=Parvularcula sp. LCG005 TaxID=3078805 RepID=UPI00294266EF|nr:CinA family protein [Parvularcula sp. LCG005]WOI54448.1 CinA family protein [Parvularcula sp. LCG005]